MSDATSWCGLPAAHVLAIYDEQHWRLRTATTLIHIAYARDLTAAQRTEALQYLNEMVQLGLFPDEIPALTVVTLARDVLLLILVGPRPRWWAFGRRRHATEQLKAARVLIRTMMQFVDVSVVDVVGAAAPLADVTKLFS